MRHRCLISPAVLVAGLCLVVAASAEMPPWSELERQVLAVRLHYIETDEGLQRAGLWSFDPEANSWERVAPFDFCAGFGSFLTGGDGRLLMQAWPFSLDLEPGSWRILRRYAPIADPAAAGWAVQGPAVSAELGQQLGLEPGIYGFATCVMVDVTGGGDGSTLPRVCEEYLLPADGQPVGCPHDGPWPLLRRGLEPDQATLARLTELPGYPMSVYPTLSLDPERHRLWRGTRQGVELLPITAGAIGQPSESHTFAFPPFDQPDGLLSLLFFHPVRQQLFAVDGLSSDPWQRFLALDDSLQPAVTYSSSGQDPMPVTLAWVGEQPALYEQLLPVIAHAPGRNGTFWTTDLWLYNPSAEPTTVRLRRVTTPTAERAVELPAHGSARIPDALQSLGGGPSGDGTTHDAVVVTSPFRWGEQVVVVARSSTPAPEGGTFGHAVTAAPGRLGYSNHLPFLASVDPDAYDQVHLNGLGAAELILDRRQPGRYRYNLGLVNDGDEAVTVTLEWGHWQAYWEQPPSYLEQRPASALQNVTAPPHSVRVVSVEELFPPEVTDHWPPRIGVWGERPLALWLSMVDNLTGDATFVPYSTFNWWTSEEFRAAVPVVAHAAGEAGTTWRTDLYGAEGPGGLDQWYGFFRASPEDCGGAVVDFGCGIWNGQLAMPLDAWVATTHEAPEEAVRGWRTIYPDVASPPPVCGTDHLHAALEVVSNTWTAAWTRTYTTRADGGTYGEMLPPYPPGGWPVQHFAGIEIGSAYRVNVGFFNGEEQTVTHRITLYSTDGRVVAERTLDLRPLDSFGRRLEHLFGLQTGDLPAGTYGMTVLPLDDPANGVKGRSWAWVSLVDTVTGDPTNWW